MADMPARTPQDYDPWELATPLQLLTLLERLDVSMSDVARWLHVPRSSVSMWRRGARAFPPKHLKALRERTRREMDATDELTDKAMRMAPTAELRQAIRAEFEALYGRWKQEVLYEAGTYRRALERQYEALGTLVHQAHFTAEDPETARVMGEALAGFVRVIYTLEPKAPSPEDATIARLTAAHAAAPPTPHEERA